MKLSLKQAAEAVGRTKSGLFHSIKTGKLVAHKNEKGLLEISAEDLFALFPPLEANRAAWGRPPTGGKTDNERNAENGNAIAAVVAEENKQLRSAKEKEFYDRIIRLETENSRLNAAEKAISEKSALLYGELQEYKIRRDAEQSRMRQAERDFLEMKIQYEKIIADKDLQIAGLSQEKEILYEQHESVCEFISEIKEQRKTGGFLRKLFA